tara:strand:- start:3093 stop:4208 length:1116 start_codon:yes stop_codon:yes gene_type:complete
MHVSRRDVNNGLSILLGSVFAGNASVVLADRALPSVSMNIKDLKIRRVADELKFYSGSSRTPNDHFRRQIAKDYHDKGIEQKFSFGRRDIAVYATLEPFKFAGQHDMMSGIFYVTQNDQVVAMIDPGQHIKDYVPIPNSQMRPVALERAKDTDGRAKLVLGARQDRVWPSTVTLVDVADLLQQKGHEKGPGFNSKDPGVDYRVFHPGHLQAEGVFVSRRGKKQADRIVANVYNQFEKKYGIMGLKVLSQDGLKQLDDRVFAEQEALPDFDQRDFVAFGYRGFKRGADYSNHNARANGVQVMYVMPSPAINHGLTMKVAPKGKVHLEQNQGDGKVIEATMDLDRWFLDRFPKDKWKAGDYGWKQIDHNYKQR